MVDIQINNNYKNKIFLHLCIRLVHCSNKLPQANAYMNNIKARQDSHRIHFGI